MYCLIFYEKKKKNYREMTVVLKNKRDWVLKQKKKKISQTGTLKLSQKES